jgi:hypothetical protein
MVAELALDAYWLLLSALLVCTLVSMGRRGGGKKMR